jgi:hypothetical protein
MTERKWLKKKDFFSSVSELEGSKKGIVKHEYQSVKIRNKQSHNVRKHTPLNLENF